MALSAPIKAIGQKKTWGCYLGIPYSLKRGYSAFYAGSFVLIWLIRVHEVI
jgi:hypothetical protein